MKTLIILILSFLLFSYSISAEEKNGAITEIVKNSEVKVLEKQINIQLKALKDELALRSKPMEKWYLFGAVILGAVIGFFFTEISARRRRKEEQIEKQKTLTDNIVADSLKFIFKTRDTIDNIITKKQQYLNLKETNRPAAAEFHSRLMNDCDEDLRKGFYTELNFHSFQLNRLRNQEIWKRYGNIVNVQSKLFAMLFKDDSLDDVKKTKDQWRELVKEFTSYCIEITKVKP